MTLLMTTFKTSVYTEVFYGDFVPKPPILFLKQFILRSIYVR